MLEANFGTHPDVHKFTFHIFEQFKAHTDPEGPTILAFLFSRGFEISVCSLNYVSSVPGSAMA